MEERMRSGWKIRVFYEIPMRNGVFRGTEYIDVTTKKDLADVLHSIIIVDGGIVMSCKLVIG